MRCTICTDIIKDDFCAAPCGHTFHFTCLTQWLAHQKSCPQCREKCLPRNVIKLYIDSCDTTLSQIPIDTQDPVELQERISAQKSSMAQKDKALEEARLSLAEIEKEVETWQLQNRELHRKLVKEQSHVAFMKRQVCSMQEELDEARELKEELMKLKRKVRTFEGVETMLKGTEQETRSVLSEHNNSASSLATMVVALKRDYQAVKEKKEVLKKEVDAYRKLLFNKDKELLHCQEQRTNFQTDVLTLEEEKATLLKKIQILQSAIDSPGSRCALKRILESPMPDHLNKKDLMQADLGTSPLLSHNRSHHVSDPVKIKDSVSHPKIAHIMKTNSEKPIKRPLLPKENIVMPVTKVPKMGGIKSLHNHVGLKFAPKRNEKNTTRSSSLVFSKGNKF